ncbi:MAG TPA: GvpL/GvpF family gas vesicle protein [Leptolyngbyaceae cyanobacterium M33_DOE_097]|uniref:GvpL/GvpF family gas vesicle protein n=1 Tax=Oscillatoriales cyanobacterium SpSt-418 TaxID=2282169 RepID=A0A7C3PCC3_9CYAN|nr:GvpL/GvpF family gas vesicle protein [Leptolyngbyaceae cyanobacterium M33_DOE_097]
MGYGLYLYGIFPAPGPQDLALTGLDQQPVQVEPVDDFVFLYSEAQQERYLASRKNLLGHERVLEQAMEAGYRTLLPLQFGLIIETWEEVIKQLIQPQGESLKQLFTRLEGKREVGVKVFWEQDSELQMLLDENPTLKSQRDSLEGKNLSMDDVVSIGQAIERSLEARKNAIIQAFRDTLNPLASQIVENDAMTEAMIYNAAYLIPWETEAEFGVKVEELDQQFSDRLKIRYNSFTAPYNFAQLDAFD